MQSDIGLTFRQVRDDLKMGCVCFTLALRARLQDYGYFCVSHLPILLLSTSCATVCQAQCCSNCISNISKLFIVSKLQISNSEQRNYRDGALIQNISSSSVKAFILC